MSHEHSGHHHIDRPHHHHHEHPNHRGHDKNHHHPHFSELVFVLNGKSIEVERVDINKPLKIAIEQALQQSGNTGRKLSDFQVKFNDQDLNIEAEVQSLKLPKEAKIFLSLKIGEGGNNNIQYAEPLISQLKFDEEVLAFKNNKKEWREKGIFLIHEQFPLMEFIFTTPKLTPSAVGYAVRFDFTNYDVEPISIKFIDPYNGNLLKKKDIKVKFMFLNFPSEIDKSIPIQAQITQQDLLQGEDEMVPFLCFKGVREYHDHPSHTGDSWLLYRNSGVGNLFNLLNQLYNYSIAQINQYNVQLVPNIGFLQQVTIPIPQ